MQKITNKKQGERFGNLTKYFLALQFIIVMSIPSKMNGCAKSAGTQMVAGVWNWSGTHTMDQDFEIQSGASFTITGTVNIYAGVTITVDPGGYLFLDNSLLQANCSGDTWNGIVEAGSSSVSTIYTYSGGHYIANTANIVAAGIPYVEMVGGEIYNAVCAVDVQNASILQVNGTYILENQIGIEIDGCADADATAAYNNEDPSADIIEDAEIGWSGIFPGQSDFGNSYCIYLNNAPYISIGGMGFHNNYGSLAYNVAENQRGYGIYSYNSNFIVATDNMIPGAGGCLVPAGGSSGCGFYDLSYGILGTASLNYTAGIESALFQECTNAIDLEYSQYSTIHNCQIQYDGSYASAIYPINFTSNNEIILRQSTNYFLYGNTLTSTNLDYGTVFVYSNSLAATGVQALIQGNSITGPSSAYSWQNFIGYSFLNDQTQVMLLCNTDANLQYDWIIDASATMENPMGTAASGWHNTWSGGSAVNIDNNSSTLIYYAEIPSSYDPTNNSGVVTVISATEPESCPAIDCAHGFPAAISEAKISEFPVNIFPNPATDYIYFGYTLPIRVHSAILTISDINGKLLKTLDLSGSSNENYLNTSDMPDGVYLYQLQAGMSVANGKIVIAR